MRSTPNLVLGTSSCAAFVFSASAEFCAIADLSFSFVRLFRALRLCALHFPEMCGRCDMLIIQSVGREANQQQRAAWKDMSV